MDKKIVLVTGASGMIGSCLVEKLLSAGMRVVGVDRCEARVTDAEYCHCAVDLGDKTALAEVLEQYKVDRVIHLAALAHRKNEADLSMERYIRVNVECSKNVFSVAEDKGIPVLFISTVDVFGFTKGYVTVDTEPHPVTNYGKSKLMAEGECKKICTSYSIFRFSPVYTPEIKRDIQKRYYLKAPKVAYLIGKGNEYEVLNIDVATSRMVEWCNLKPDNKVHIIKDEYPLIPAECIRKEKALGNAKYVIHCPRWIALCGYSVLRFFTGKNKYTYLLNKAVYPLKTK